MAEFTGRIIQKLDIQSGTSKTGKAWTKQLVIAEETAGSFPRKACFTFFGEDRVFDLKTFDVGTDVVISYDPESREYGGRWSSCSSSFHSWLMPCRK